MTLFRTLDNAEKFHDRQASLRPGYSARNARRHQAKAKMFKMTKTILRETKKGKAS